MATQNFEYVHLCLGSNCDCATHMLARARECIVGLQDCELDAASAIYRTEPQEKSDQPWFANQVLRLKVSGWEPEQLLVNLLRIESSLGRVRDVNDRFGPRVIDIDLLLFGSRKSQNPICLLPHPRMFRRAFVLRPLLDLNPDLEVDGKKLADLLAKLDWYLDGDRIYQSQNKLPILTQQGC